MPVEYRFGQFVLDPGRRGLTRDGVPVSITPKAFDILLHLAKRPKLLVLKADLMKAVWHDTIVEDGNLTQNVSLLRKALGDAGSLIVTIPRRGYRFNADVETVDQSTLSTPPAEHAAHSAPLGSHSPQRPDKIGDTPASTRRSLRSAAVLGVVLTLAFLAGSWVAWQRARTSSPSAATPIRLAVLPLANLTGDSTQEYLADGLTEELITRLARVRPEQLAVIARTSVMRYKHTDRRIDEIGRDLTITYALESSLRRTGDRMRVTVQLIRVPDQSHLWANDFDYASQDVFQIEDSVATAVANEVQLRLTPTQRSHLPHGTTSDAIALDAVMRGRDLLNAQRGRDDWRAAKAYFDRAIASDSGYALAWAYLSVACRRGADRGWLPTGPGYGEARLAALRAVALDPNLPEAWERLAQYQSLVEWDWDNSQRSLQRALDLDPNGVDAILMVADSKAALGQVDTAIALEMRAIQLDPLAPEHVVHLGELYFEADRVADARRIFDGLSPDVRKSYALSELQLYLAENRVIDAAALVSQIPDTDWQMYTHALVSAKQGSKAEADSALAAYINRLSSHAAYQVAGVYAFRGNADSAFAWLDRAYVQHDGGLLSIKVNWLLRGLHADPRYAKMLARLRLPP